MYLSRFYVHEDFTIGNKKKFCNNDALLFLSLEIIFSVATSDISFLFEINDFLHANAHAVYLVNVISIKKILIELTTVA